MTRVEDSRFCGRGEWIAAVERALSRHDAQQIFAAKAIDPETVLAVARCEVSMASTAGVSMVSHAQLEQLTGFPRYVVLRARLALIELGLEDLAAAPGAPGNVHRELRHP
ncbi:hypothetical protein GCM10023068_11070 [Leifsonia shinshuensis]